MHLRLAPFLARVIFIQARQVAIVALVQGFVARGGQLAIGQQVLQQKRQCFLRPLQVGRKGQVEFSPRRF